MPQPELSPEDWMRVLVAILASGSPYYVVATVLTYILRKYHQRRIYRRHGKQTPFQKRGLQ